MESKEGCGVKEDHAEVAYFRKDPKNRKKLLPEKKR